MMSKVFTFLALQAGKQSRNFVNTKKNNKKLCKIAG